MPETERRSPVQYVEEYLTDYCPSPVLERLTCGHSPHFFDIETTGLQPKGSYTYLIGSLKRTPEGWLFRQWFAENADEEVSVLTAFGEALCPDDMLIHYNGCAFDIPFLNERYAMHKLPSPLPDKQDTMDLFRLLACCKSMFRLENRKQPSLETVSGFRRTDPYDGGTLIAFYSKYVALCRFDKARAKELLDSLLLHNHDDIMGLASVSSLLAFTGLDTLVLSDISRTNTSDTVTLTAQTEYAFPAVWRVVLPLPEIPEECLSTDVEHNPPEDYEGRYLNLVLSGDRIKLTLPRYTMAPYYYFPNYRDYYYLPMEGKSIHKSLASFVDKAYRTPATKENARQQKSGSFLPQIREQFTPAFRFRHDDELCFFEEREASEAELAEFLRSWLLYARTSR